MKACSWKIDTHTHLYLSLQGLDLDTQPTRMLAMGSSHLQLHSAQTYTCTNGSLSRLLYFVLPSGSFPEPHCSSGRQARNCSLWHLAQRYDCSDTHVPGYLLSHWLSSLTFTSNHELTCITFLASIAVTLRLQFNCGTEIPHMRSSTLVVEFTIQHMS